MQSEDQDGLFEAPGVELGEEGQQQMMAEMAKHRRRPPQFDQMMAFVKSIVKKVDMVKGAQISGGMSFSNNTHMNHSFTFPLQTQNKQKKMMGQTGEATYSFDLQYLGGEIKTQFDQPSVIMMGKSENTGRLEAVLIKKVSDALSLKFQAFYPNSMVEHAYLTYEADYHGADFNSNFKYNNAFQSLNLSQKIGHGLALGFEFVNMPARKFLAFSYAAKYNYLNKVFLAQNSVHQQEVSLAVQQNINKTTTLVSNLDWNTGTNETNMTLGYKQKFSACEVTSTVNSKAKIATILSTQANFFGLKLCGVANLIKNTYKFGFGINIGQRH